jgi:hypothetical protein
MKAKLLTGLVLFSLIGVHPAHATELKPYQEEALKKLEAFHGKHWPAVRQQYESVIQQASEQQAQAMVKMITEAREKANVGSDNDQTVEPDSREDRKRIRAVRKEIENQIEKTHDDFIERVAQLTGERHNMGQEANREVYGAEKGARLSAVSDTFRHRKFITDKSINEGFEELRVARERLLSSKTYIKVMPPAGSFPDNTSIIRSLVDDATMRIKNLNNQYGQIAANIKKRKDAIPYGGGVDVHKANKDLSDEQERHDKLLSAEVVKAVNELQVKIAEQDKILFNWVLKPLRDAQPHSEPVAQR